MKCSVLVAAYNGEAYIAQQLASILPQLGEEDEVLISDDSRGPLTKEACRRFLKDPRVTYLEGPHKGIDKNKEFLLRQCTGDVAFLADQDDVWLPHKVKRVMAAIQGGACCVMHNARLTDSSTPWANRCSRFGTSAGAFFTICCSTATPAAAWP